MFSKKLIRQISLLCKYKSSSPKTLTNFARNVHVSCANYKDDKSKETKEIMHRSPFEQIQNKNRDTYLETIRMFINRDSIYRRGHVEFIYAALKNMEEFGVAKDLTVYKALIDILPKGKFIPQNIIQAEFMHYPKQQQCIIDLLEQMEDNAVMPDAEMEPLLLNVFGKKGFPLRKYWRMMYWMPKFKNASPWPVPQPVPDDAFELAKLAIERISSVDESSQISIYETHEIKDSIDDTWIVSAQSQIQKKLLGENKDNSPLYVEGSYKVWIKNKPVNYFVLRGSPRPLVEIDEDTDDVSNLKVSLFGLKPPVNESLQVLPSVHEQEDGVYYSVCATGTSSKDSLLSWIRHLEKDGNPKLGTTPIVFTLKQSNKEIANINTTNSDSEEKEKTRIEES